MSTLSSKTQIVTANKKIDSEDLLNIDGSWNLVEKSQSYDPAKAHLKARKNVNVKRRKKKNAFSAQFEPNAKSGQDGNLRILRLEPQNNDWGDVSPDYQLAGTSVSTPTHMVAGRDVLRDVKLFLAEDEASGHGYANGEIITPPDLPPRKRKNVAIPKIKPLGFNAVDKSVPVPRTKPNINPSPKIKKITLDRSSPSSVNKLRFGLNSGNTRIVIEVSHTTKYKVAVDGLRNVFRVKLENTHWNIKPQGSFKGSDLLGTYVARQQSDGSVLLEMRLKKNAKIINTMVLKPNATPNHRVVIDLQGI